MTGTTVKGWRSRGLYPLPPWSLLTASSSLIKWPERQRRKLQYLFLPQSLKLLTIKSILFCSLLVTQCYGLNICLTTNIQPNPEGDNVRRQSLWKVIKSQRWCCEEQGLHKRTKRLLSHNSIWEHTKKFLLGIGKQSSPDTVSTSTWILNFSISRT